MRLVRLLTVLTVLLPFLPFSAAAPPAPRQLLLPRGRNAYYSSERIPIAVTGLEPLTTATVELLPQRPGAKAVKLSVEADGSTTTMELPPFSLAPNSYTLRLDGKDAGKLTIATGARRSSMLVSQSSTRPPEGGANFSVGNAASFGLLDPQGQPDRNPRGKRSAGSGFFENAVETDIPTLVYMYWTGYVLHKPFGDEKCWADPVEQEAMRLLSLHTAQQVRRFAGSVVSIGPLDEPGLAWGRTPAGGMASGFPNWPEKEWYEKRGWHYRQNIAAGEPADWMKYLTIRCGIIKENYVQAKKDIHTAWPQAVWSADLYAPSAIMDGTDPLNQQVNQVPSSHVFFDFFGGPLGVPGMVYLEKAHDPAAALAHAMNGQLTGTPGPQPPLYHVLMNGLLAAGIHSNWWLNTGGMTNADLAAVNGPAERWGPLFLEMPPKHHDVAVLWSFTEIGMRERDICAQEAKKKTGEQIKLLVPLPGKDEAKGAEINTSAYEVGGVYANQVLGVHQSLSRAGYPAHFLHEKLLPGGVLKDYRVLVIVGQTHEPPADVRAAIENFVRYGGQVVVDPSTTVKFPGQIVCPIRFSAEEVRARSALNERLMKAAKNKRDASVYDSSLYFNQPERRAAADLKATLTKTKARPVFQSADVNVIGEHHQGGEGELFMVLNGHEDYPPNQPENKPYARYNFVPGTVHFTLPGIARDRVVYEVSGLDWQRVRPVQVAGKPITAPFEAGEMKLYLVAPRAPQGLDVTARVKAGRLEVHGRLKDLKMPWPLTLTVRSADGHKLYELYRATGPDGTLSETLPVGRNASPGSLTVKLTSPVAGLSAETRADAGAGPVDAQPVKKKVRVFDEPAIRRFLASRPEVVVAVGNDSQKAVADELARKLNERGVRATVRPEVEVLHRHVYPRVWDPYTRLYRPTGPTRQPAGNVKLEVTLSTAANGVVTARGPDGKPVDNWRAPGTRVTVAGDGYLDWLAPHEFAYEPGCVLYFDDHGQMSVLKGEMTEVKATDELRRKWAKPWHQLMQHVGGFQLPPELPEAYSTDRHLILLGDSTDGMSVAALQASEVLYELVDASYPGPGKALLSFAWSPFGVDRNVILVGASNPGGLKAGIGKLVELAGR